MEYPKTILEFASKYCNINSMEPSCSNAVRRFVFDDFNGSQKLFQDIDIMLKRIPKQIFEHPSEDKRFRSLFFNIPQDVSFYDFLRWLKEELQYWEYKGDNEIYELDELKKALDVVYDVLNEFDNQIDNIDYQVLVGVMKALSFVHTTDEISKALLYRIHEFAGVLTSSFLPRQTLPESVRDFIAYVDRLPISSLPEGFLITLPKGYKQQQLIFKFWNTENEQENYELYNTGSINIEVEPNLAYIFNGYDETCFWSDLNLSPIWDNFNLREDDGVGVNIYDANNKNFYGTGYYYRSIFEAKAFVLDSLNSRLPNLTVFLKNFQEEAQDKYNIKTELDIDDWTERFFAINLVDNLTALDIDFNHLGKELKTLLKNQYNENELADMFNMLNANLSKSYFLKQPHKSLVVLYNLVHNKVKR